MKIESFFLLQLTAVYKITANAVAAILTGVVVGVYTAGWLAGWAAVKQSVVAPAVTDQTGSPIFIATTGFTTLHLAVYSLHSV